METEDQGIINLSVSRIKLFEQCPAKYNYKYNLGLSEKKTPALAIGSFAHKILEFAIEYVLNEKMEMKAALQRGYKESLALQGKELEPVSQENLELIKSWIKKYYKERLQINSHKFIKAEEDFEVLFGPFNMRGQIDRVDEFEDGIKVIDYKTNKSGKYLDSFQLAVYTIIVEAKYKLPVVKAEYHLLRDSSTKSYVFNEEVLEEARQKILNVGYEILSGENFEPKPSILCNYCDFFFRCRREHALFNSW